MIVIHTLVCSDNTTLHLFTQIMTGSGTFESYVGVGSGCAATPDGRLKGQPIASDCSQQPYPQVY